MLAEMKKYLMIAIPIVVAILIGSCESSIGRLPVIVPEDAPELTDLSGGAIRPRITGERFDAFRPEQTEPAD